MGVKFGFYNSMNGDRKYDAEDMASIFDGLISEGVFSTFGQKMLASANNNMTITVGTGRCWFWHTWTYVNEPEILTIDMSDDTLDRIDTIFLKLDKTPSERRNSIVVVKGVPSNTPKAKEMPTTNLVRYVPLAEVYVKHGAVAITGSSIKNLIGTNVCPFVKNVVDGMVTTTELLTQWETEFNEWFAMLHVTMEGNVATNLQANIDAVQDQIDKLPIIRSGTSTPSDSLGKNGDVYFKIIS